MVIGDFNNVLTIEDKVGGSYVHVVEFYDFEFMMDAVGLYEHDNVGIFKVLCINHNHPIENITIQSI